MSQEWKQGYVLYVPSKWQSYKLDPPRAINEQLQLMLSMPSARRMLFPCMQKSGEALQGRLAS